MAGEAQGPVRMCCVCRRRLPQESLLRHARVAVAGSDKPALVADPKRRLPGKGFYVCDRVECRERFLRHVDGRK